MNTQPQCGSCKFWGTDEEQGQIFRQCTRIIHQKRGTPGICLWKKDDPDFADEYREELAHDQKLASEHKAITLDGSGYFAALKCTDDFGCVYHEPKS